MEKRIDSFRPALPESLLREYNFFELYPFDGGGRFIQQEIAGSIDDRAITRNILSGGALIDFLGVDGKIDFLKYEQWSTIEKSCWINRMYFIVSMARTAMLDNDPALAERVVGILLDFHARYQPPRGKEAVAALNARVTESRDRDYNSGNANGRTEYQWYDFQPASRIINVLHAMFFLRAFPNISAEQWTLLDDFLRSNADVICDGEEQLALAPGNHQALRGLALLYAARHFGDSRYAEHGARICNYHAVNDYLPDGMLIDMSPSYHLFEAWIGRDARIFGALNQEACAMLDRAFDLCARFQCPDGFSIVLNDGYPLDMRGFLKSIPKRAVDGADTFLLPESHLLFRKSKRFFAILDATPCTGKYAHFHAGKNAPTLWCDGRPFLVDSGCCNYDDPDFQQWFKQAEAHSTLLVNGKGDGVLQGRYSWNLYPEHAVVQDAPTFEERSSAPGWEGVVWTRSLKLEHSRAVICDQVRAPESKNYTFLFILAPEAECRITETEILLDNGGTILRLTWEADAPVRWESLPGKVFREFRKLESARLAAHLAGDNIHFRLTAECVSASQAKQPSSQSHDSCIKG